MNARAPLLAPATKHAQQEQRNISPLVPMNGRHVNAIADLGEILHVVCATDVGYPEKINKLAVLVCCKHDGENTESTYIFTNKAEQEQTPDARTTLTTLIKLLREESYKRKYPSKAVARRVEKDLILNILSKFHSHSANVSIGNPREKEVDELLLACNELKASDIHISSSQQNSRENFIKLRVNGELEYYKHPERAHEEITSLTAVMYSTLAPRDGGQIDGKEFDALRKSDAVMYRTIEDKKFGVRIASHPTSGSADEFYLVMRFLGNQNESVQYVPLDQVGYLFNQKDIILNNISGKGIVLVIGETNSGKSASIINLLIHIHKESKDKKAIYSLENPTEKQVEGVRQFNLSASGEQTRDQFKDKVQALLEYFSRADADAVNVAEIRDQMTANAAQMIALSGQSVFATLHCDSPFDVPERYIALGGNPELVKNGETMKTIIAQKLLPELCPTCSYTIDNVPKLNHVQRQAIKELNQAGLGHKVPLLRFRNFNETCSNPACRFGLVGRKLIAEAVALNEDIRGALFAGHKTEARKLWLQQGNFSKADCALYRAFLGQVDIGKAREELGVLTETFEVRKRHNIEHPRSIYE